VNRDGNGRFAKGQSGNPGGRPKKARGERYYEITQAACTFKEWREIIRCAVEQAKDGDRSARKFLADYLLGPPPQEHLFGNLPGESFSHIVEIVEVKLSEPVESQRQES
jgi:hypothetical protein